MISLPGSSIYFRCCTVYIYDSLIFLFSVRILNLQVIAEHLSLEEVAGIQEGFKIMDTSNNGKINIDELKIGLHKLGHQIPDTDVHILMEAVSTILF